MTTLPVALAPAAVVRVAAYPLARVADLAEPTLAALARAAVPSDRSAWTAYLAAYADALTRGRAALWARTAEDPGFMRALTLGNPELAASVADTHREPRNKRVRHRETSLYRHLARSVARPEPNGMWAGVTLAHLDDGEGVRCEAAPARCNFAPDLAPFVALFAGLAERPAYRARALYKLNPTLQPHEGGHRFSAPAPGGGSMARQVAPSRALTAAIAALRGGPACFTLADAAESLRALGFPAQASAGLVDLLREQGVLVGGLRFPTRFESAWDALEQAAARLLPADAELWRGAVIELQAQCTALDAGALELAPAALAEELGAASELLAALADALELPCPTLPRAALRCDLAAPLRITFGRDVAAHIAATAAEFTGFLAHLGMNGALSPALIDRWLGANGQSLAGFTPPPGLRDPVTLATWEALGEELGPELARRAAAWAERLTTGETDEIVTPEPPEAPGEAAMACLLFSFRTDAACPEGQPPALVLRGLVRDATPAFARCGGLLEPQGGPLTRWLTAQYTRVAEASGVDQAALCFSHASPNVQACPRLVADAVDVWGAEPGAVDLRGARIQRHPVTLAPVCVVPGRARPLAIHSFSAAALASDDAAQNLLLMTSLRTPPQIPRGDRLGFRAELESRRHSPRVRMPGGAVVRTRRSALIGEDLRALTGAAPGPARFAVWQRLAAERGWPALVMVHRDGEPPLLVPRDAPLAVEAMSEGAAACACITVEEFIDDTWITGPTGERHVAELALPLVRPALLALWAARSTAEPLADCA